MMRKTEEKTNFVCQKTSLVVAAANDDVLALLAVLVVVVVEVMEVVEEMERWYEMMTAIRRSFCSGGHGRC